MTPESGLSLLCRVHTRICALPLANVIETMRPLPTERISGAPDFVLGLSIVRGAPAPVVDSGRLLTGVPVAAARFVILRVGARRVALAVESVLGVGAVDRDSLADLPPLLHGSDAEVATAVGALDSELLLVLAAARMVPDELLAGIEKHALAS